MSPQSDVPRSNLLSPGESGSRISKALCALLLLDTSNVTNRCRRASDSYVKVGPTHIWPECKMQHLAEKVQILPRRTYTPRRSEIIVQGDFESGI